MIMMKVCLVLLCFTLAFAKFEGNHEEFESSLRKLLDALKDKHSENLNEERRLLAAAADDDKDEADLAELDSASDKQEETTPGSNELAITLQNRAAMSARLRVLYTDEYGIPFLVETPRILTGKSKSVSVPSTAKVIKVLIDRETFIDTWKNTYTGLLETNEPTACFRIIGTLMTPKVKHCPEDN